jgi:hypothetical protein
MPLTTHDIHTCHPAATNLSSSRNSTPFTNHETYNSHPTAMCPLDSTLYTPNPLSTPTSDCQAVPDTVG